MGVETYVKVGGVWRPSTGSDEMYVKVGGAWRTVLDHYVKVNGRWRQQSAAAPPLPGGTYVLSAQSLYLPSAATGYATFNTAEYQGKTFVGLWARISWRSATGLDNEAIATSGRPNGNFYRTINNDGNEWDGRTIDHRIDTFDASSLTDFSSGAATGFTFTDNGPPKNLGASISNVQLVLQIT